MRLWTVWFEAVAHLRPACSRGRTFAWMVVALIGLSVRTELAGVTSFVRVLELSPKLYKALLHLFHSPAIKLEPLTYLWVRWCRRTFTPLLVDQYLVVVADGLKVAKEGRKMPAVKKLHQSSGDNSKAPFIFGHSFQAVSLLVRTAAGHINAVPLAARIHEGVVWSNRDRRTLLDKLVLLFVPLTEALQAEVVLLADSFYASCKIIAPLLARGHHLITRAKTNSVAYQPPPPPSSRRRGRPALYGKRVALRDLFAQIDAFIAAPSPIYGEHTVTLAYRSVDLLWRPVGRLVRFVLVIHPVRGTVILMCTNPSLDPLDVIVLYSYRFKIENGFRQALRVVGTYAYHFWMKTMTPIRRVTGNQHMHTRTEAYRAHVRRKLAAYHNHVPLGCIAQGLLQYLAISYASTVWQLFRSWLRTMDAQRPPSELVVAHALRDTLPEFLRVGPDNPTLAKFLREKLFSRQPPTHQAQAA